MDDLMTSTSQVVDGHTTVDGVARRRLLLFEPHEPLEHVIVDCAADIGLQAEVGRSLAATVLQAERDPQAIVLIELCQDCVVRELLDDVLPRMAGLERLVVIVESGSAVRAWQSRLPRAAIFAAPFELSQLLGALGEQLA
jgi:hypothetical protein